MRPTHSALLSLLFAGALVVPGGGLRAQLSASEGGPQSHSARLAAMASELLEKGKVAFVAAESWVLRNYARRPTLMVGLAGALALPTLALGGLFLYRRRPGDDAPAEARDDDIQPAMAAWIEIEGCARVAMLQSRDFLQIGRQDDNDVCLADESVHRYHAVIERSARQGFVIVDISGPSGNGVVVNGERRQRAQLTDGDTVEVGRSRFRFATAA